jgi:hypothetical protein
MPEPRLSTSPPLRSLEHADQARRFGPGVAPNGGRLNDERMQTGSGGGRLHIGSRVSEPHLRSEGESVAFASLDAKREQAVLSERGRDRGDKRGEVADICERVGGDDEIEDRRDIALEQRRRLSDYERV